MKIRSHQDFWTGLLFAATGTFFAGFASSYSMGTAAKMGPGYFPFWIGLLQIILGAVVIISSMRNSTAEERIARFDLKSMALVLGAVVLFGLLLKPLGLALTLFILIAVSSLASHEFSWKATVANSVVLISLCFAVFVWGLKLQFPLWPSFFQI
ncbi:MAG: tripartite tricarboxylate transporter TctB family protein [Burkholderiaceae bacterium]|nr:tripartite tricarboxylate transporter TctB family protein [Burkholderiaceae bacterium]